MQKLNLIKSIVELAREGQMKQTKDVLLLINNMPETPEILELKERLKIADEKINKQCNFILRVDKLVKKSALQN